MSQNHSTIKGFDPDLYDRKVVIATFTDYPEGREYHRHSHNKDQLVLPVFGAMTSEVEDGIWMVPNQSALWIPAGQIHVNKPSTKSCFHFVYFQSDLLQAMPQKCCTLFTTPLIRELIEHLAALDQFETPDNDSDRIMDVLIQQLTTMQVQQLNFVIPDDQRLQTIANILRLHPSDRRTVGEWAEYVAMSERSLARLVVQQTGLTFGRWRQQLHVIKALQRLSDNVSVQATSDELGYESVSAFIRMFSKALGKSPGKYISESNRFRR
ncbi:AraC family transcriptional regulator [Photobacterium sp. DNB22_13_2]